MRLQELFETTEEDRAIISLSTAIYEYLKKYKNDNKEYIEVGKIGDIVDTPLGILNPIYIVLLSNERMVDYVDSPPEKITFGLWEPTKKTIILNDDYLESNILKSTLSHELRHALDDYKSEFKASSSTRYATPKNRSLRNIKNDPYAGNLNYLAQPAEINARFLQAMHSVTMAIQRAKKLSPDQIMPSIMAALNKAFDLYKISGLFPEKEKSKDYKRLVKRAMDFINKELAHVQSQ